MNYPVATNAGCWRMEISDDSSAVARRGREGGWTGLLELGTDSVGVFDTETDGGAETSYRARALPRAESPSVDSLLWVPQQRGFVVYWFRGRNLYAYQVKGQGTTLRGYWLVPGFHASEILNSSVSATRVPTCPRDGEEARPAPPPAG